MLNRIKKSILSWRIMQIARLVGRYSKFVGNKDKLSYYPREPRKSKSKIFFEQVANALKHSALEDYYYEYGHDRVSVTDTSAYMLEPVHERIIGDANEYPYGKHPNWENNFNYKALVRDKYTFALIMESLGLPVPKTVGMVAEGRFYSHDEKREMPLEEISRFDMNVMFKPVTGNGGKGMHHIVIKDGVITKSGRTLTPAELKSEIGNERYLLQNFVTEQHPAMAGLFPGAINTLRVTMVRDDNGEVQVLGVMCLMGAGDMIVSNWHYGGIIVNVNPDGSLNEFGYSNSLKRTDHHPDTGVVFKDFRVPFYNEMIDICTRAMKQFYGLKTLGWDIAITPDGPIFIEGNDMWGMPAHQIVEERGWKEFYPKYFHRTK